MGSAFKHRASDHGLLGGLSDDDHPQYAGVELLGSYSAVSQASVDITSKISATYDDYEIRIVGLRPGTDATGILLRTSTDNGATWDQGASDYSGRSLIDDSNGGTNHLSGVASFIPISANGDVVNSSSLGGMDAVIRLANVNNTTLQKRVKIDGGYVRTTTAYLANVNAVWRRAAVANIDAVRIYVSSGTFAEGNIYIYGIAKA